MVDKASSGEKKMIRWFKSLFEKSLLRAENPGVI